MKTINQITAFCKSNATICLSTEMIAKYNDRRSIPDKEYYKYRSFKTTDKYRSDTIKNNVWIAARTYLRRFINDDKQMQAIDTNKGCTVKIEGLTSYIEVDISFGFEFYSGAVIRASYYDINKYRYFDNFTPEVVKSNSTFADFDFKAYFENKMLPKYLFPQGLFRSIQIVANLNKKDALQYYREYLSLKGQKKHEDQRYIDTEIFTAWKRRYRRYKNIIISHEFTNEFLAQAFDTHARQKKLTYLIPQRSMNERLFEYSNYYDTDDISDMLEYIDGCMSDFPERTIFV